MVGKVDMDDEVRVKNQKLMAGCGLVPIIGLITLAGILLFFTVRDRQAAQYPGSQPVSSHSNYQGLPFAYRWDNSYRTSDNFTKIYNWYSITFDMGAEKRAIGACILLEGSNDQFLFSRHTSAFLCNAPYGQMIYVTRSTSFTGLSAFLSGVEELSRLIIYR